MKHISEIMEEMYGPATCQWAHGCERAGADFYEWETLGGTMQAYLCPDHAPMGVEPKELEDPALPLGWEQTPVIEP